MRNITVAINDQVYLDVRVWCAQRDTSVSAVVQRFLEDLPHLKQSRRFPLPGAKPAPYLHRFIQAPEAGQGADQAVAEKISSPLTGEPVKP